MVRFLGGLAALASCLAITGVAQTAPAPQISAAEMSATVRVLAYDAFEGRAPGTPGETKTVAYLIERFKALGLQPGGKAGSWTQPVPLVRTQVGADPKLSIDIGSERLPLVQSESVYVSTLHPIDRVSIAKAPLVFVGYWVSAPERQWNDFKGVDLKGKIAVFLINDPDFEAAADEPVAGRFGGKAMTYYGRWTYKYEEAARRGAIGALIVHETPGAGYGWSTVTAPQGEAYDIKRRAGDPQPVLLQGWLSRDTAVDLFRRAGLDFEALKRKARQADFAPVTLQGETFNAAFAVAHSAIESHNVLARLAGTQRPGETIVYAAHWDAYGIGKPDAHGDSIRHGANDDALGVAAVLDIARAFKAGPAPERSVVFALWTAEERGLLGSETYAVDPVYPFATTVANFTMDILNTAGPSRDVVLIGAGQNSLESDLRAAAAAQGRTVTPDAHPEKGLFYRADHFSLAKRGAPTLLLMAIGGGPDLIVGGRTAGDKWVDDYTANCYHKGCDAWSPNWDLRGAAQDVQLVYAVGRKIADSPDWPRWNTGSEFKTIRDRSTPNR